MMFDASQAIPKFRITCCGRMDAFYACRLPWWKRTLDIVGSIAALIFFFPLIVATAVFIRWVSPGPVLFRQTRIGAGGRPFDFIKFRTMQHNADASHHQQYLAELIHGDGEDDNAAPMIKMDSDPRIIPFGGFLRKSCIDELPQLINVLKGQMSLVGPRPPIPYEVAEYLKWHNGRFACMPGMTGLWQVSGKNRLTFKEMVRLDITYARRMSLLFDLRIIVMTPIAILKQILDGRAAKRREEKPETGGAIFGGKTVHRAQ